MPEVTVGVVALPLAMAFGLASGVTAQAGIAGIVHALTLLVVVLVLAPPAFHVPLATLPAVLFVVAYNMREWREIAGILPLDLADKSVWLITFALTVVADLTVAVQAGSSLPRRWRSSRCSFRCSTTARWRSAPRRSPSISVSSPP